MENIKDLPDVSQDDFDGLSKKEKRKKLKELRKMEEKRNFLLRYIQKWTTGLLVLALVFGGVYLMSRNRRILPPTDITGHIEQNPPAHVLDEPMPLAIQKHMLEHADGKGKPGVVINYNCKDFECEENLKEKLAEIADRYPEFVYIAPYPDMSVKIAVTKIGKIETFDEFDKEALIRFIEGQDKF